MQISVAVHLLLPYVLRHPKSRLDLPARASASFSALPLLLGSAPRSPTSRPVPVSRPSLAGWFLDCSLPTLPLVVMSLPRFVCCCYFAPRTTTRVPVDTESHDKS